MGNSSVASLAPSPAPGHALERPPTPFLYLLGFFFRYYPKVCMQAPRSGHIYMVGDMI